MSKIFPKELVDALGLIHDISIGLVSEKVYLFRSSITRNAYDEEVADFSSSELIDAFIKYPKIPRIYPGAFYDEAELPIMARIKNADLVKQNDMILVKVQGLERLPEWKKYKIVDVLARVVTNMEVYAEYKLVPDRATRDFWVAEDCVGEDFDGDLTENWDIIESDYTLDTGIKHSGLRSIDGGITSGALFQSKLAYVGLKFNVWTLLSAGGYYISRFRKVDDLNYYELKCEVDGAFLKYYFNKIAGGVSTLITSATTSIDISVWINVLVETVFECNYNRVTNRVYFTDATHTEQFIVEDSTNPIGAGVDGKFQIGVFDSHMDGQMVFCNLYHIE